MPDITKMLFKHMRSGLGVIMAKILVVDDDIEILRLIRKLLTRAGHKVATASDSTDAIKQCFENPADVAIIDILMPDRSGIEIITTITSHLPATKIIAVSGGGNMGPEVCLETARRFGVKYTFEKPVDNKRLLQSVDDLVQEKVPR